MDGLVNVAGIGMVRPLEYALDAGHGEIFDINFFGQLAARFRPLAACCDRARGRIVNITTVGVNLAIPFGGILNASKSAFAMLSDTMRLELRPFGVRVLRRGTGSISTPAVDKTLGDMEKVIDGLPPDAQAAIWIDASAGMGRLRHIKMEKEGVRPMLSPSGASCADCKPAANPVPCGQTCEAAGHAAEDLAGKRAGLDSRCDCLDSRSRSSMEMPGRHRPGVAYVQPRAQPLNPK